MVETCVLSWRGLQVQLVRLSYVLLAILSIAVAAPGGAFAQDAVQSDAERIGRAYMNAYSAADWEGMIPYMADDFVLIDRTNTDPNFVPEYHGPRATIDMLRQFGRDGGVIELGFEWSSVFSSNNVVVFSGFVNTLSAPPGRDSAFRWRAEQVTALTVRDGKIVRHEDFANYATPVVSRVPRPS